jgi:hypothetical protein
MSTSPTYSLFVSEPPNHVRPYVLPHLSGPAVQLIDNVICVPVTKNSFGGAFSFVQLNGQGKLRCSPTILLPLLRDVLLLQRQNKHVGQLRKVATLASRLRRYARQS